jgi:hypothetical protein
MKGVKGRMEGSIRKEGGSKRKEEGSKSNLGRD